MQQVTRKMVGVAVLGAAFAALGTGVAAAADPAAGKTTTTVVERTADGKVVRHAPVQTPLKGQPAPQAAGNATSKLPGQTAPQQQQLPVNSNLLGGLVPGLGV